MRYGTITEAVNAINQAKNTRGTSLGCPQEVVTYATPNITEPFFQLSKMCGVLCTLLQLRPTQFLALELEDMRAMQLWVLIMLCRQGILRIRPN